MPKLDTLVTKKDLQKGKPIRVDVGNKPILLVRVSENVYAMDAVCSHEGGPLEEGTIEGHSLTCPWHAAVFDIRSAKVSPETNWATDLKSYPVAIDDKSGRILIDTDSDSQSDRPKSSTNTEQKI